MVCDSKNGANFSLAQYPIALIVARSTNYVIGCSNQLPWRQRDDLRRFKKHTLGKPVIVGRLTYESIGSPLPGRQTIVLTRNKAIAEKLNADQDSDVVAATSIEDAIECANSYLANSSLPDFEREIMVAGGQEIFEAFIAHADKIYLTVVEANVEDGDAYFPKEDRFAALNQQVVGRHPQDSQNEYSCTYYVYARQKSVLKKAEQEYGEAETTCAERLVTA